MTDFYQTPQGEFEYPWLTKPDTKFATDGSGGLYKVDLVVSDEADAEALKAKIEAASQAALDDHTDDMTAAQKKKWSLYVPFGDHEDDNDEPTGHTVFRFKQNAVIRKRDGTESPIKITMFDARNNEVQKTSVFAGTIGCVMFSMRKIVMASSKQVGVRLDFFTVQIIKPGTGKKRSSGFAAVEGGWDSSQGDNETEEEPGDY